MAYRCAGCDKPINPEEPHFYFGYWSRNKIRSSVIHYHSACCEEIAGAEYLERIKGGGIDDDQHIVSDNTTTTAGKKVRWRYEAYEEK